MRRLVAGAAPESRGARRAAAVVSECGFPSLREWGDPLILIAEDNWLPALELEEQLAADGRHVVVAPTPEAALAAAAAERPKLAVVDLQLKEGMDGVALARALAHRGVPVLIYTGFDKTAAQQALGDTPVVGILQKPAPTDALLTAIRAGLRGEAA